MDSSSAPRSRGRSQPWAARAERGFSLLELMIVLAIVGILLSLTLPAMGTMMMQSQVKSKADNIISGIQLARAEAFKRNAAITVQFEKYNALIAQGTGGFTIGCAATVYNASAPASLKTFCPGSAFVDAATSLVPTSPSIYRYPAEGGGNYPLRFSPTPSGSVAALTFDSFGNLASTNPDGSSSVTTIEVRPKTSGALGMCALVGSVSACQVNIVISSSGGARACYPSMVANSSPMAC